MGKRRKPVGGEPPRVDKDTVKHLRSNATEAEALLWKFLRNRHGMGFKFRRQHEAGGYVLDFYCAEVKLAVEVDGGIHEERKPYDAARTAALEARGLAVLRVTNEEVMADPGVTAAKIAAACRKRHHEMQ